MLRTVNVIITDIWEACAFYDATIILLPYDQSYENVIRQLHDTKADLLIAQAGSLALEQLTSRLADLKGVVWVVEESSRQMDWETAPLGDKPNIKDVTSWHKLVEKNTGKTTATLPSRSSTLERARVITVWLKDDDKVPDIVEFTQKVRSDFSYSKRRKMSLMCTA